MPGRGDEHPGEGVAELDAAPEQMAKWVAAAAEQGIFFESMLVSAWSILLSRYLRVEDVAFHVIWANSPGEQHLQFPVRCQLNGLQSLAELMLAMESQTRGSLKHAKNAPMNELPELESGVLFDPNGTAEASDFGACPLGLAVEVRRGVMRLFYGGVLPTEKSAERMIAHLFVVLDQLSEQRASLQAGVSLLSAAEWQREIHEWNETTCLFPALTLHESFAAVLEKRPNAVAAQKGSQVLTYAEVDAYAGRLAQRLSERGAGPEERVAIAMERSFEFLVSMLAVMKTGAAYVPVDPELPEERRRFILRKSGVNLALVRKASGDDLCPAVRRMRVDLAELTGGDTHHYKGKPGDCAYVIFTSGSTGEPKGVAVSHGSSANNARACIQAWELTPDDVFLQFASPGFDVSVEEIWTAWLSGGRLVLQEDAAMVSFRDFCEWVRLRGISVMNLPTAFWHSLVSSMAHGETKLPVGVRLLIAGGEEVSVSVYEKWRSLVSREVRFVNAYGPTEAAVTSTMFRDWCDDRSRGFRMPIGRPIANVSHYVVDSYGNPQPQGIPGELWIAGAGVAIGYVSDAERTAESFQPNPFGVPGDRCYASGDLVFADEGGAFYYLGRGDRQIKVRGCRIEPGEIENVLREHPEVGDAYFCLHRESEGVAQLCAWVTPAGDYWPSESVLRVWLEDRLPPWMIPGAVITIDRLPLTSSGKIDESALPSKNRMPMKKGRLVNEEERLLARAWKEVIGVAPQMREQDFFEMGGDSLSAMVLVGRIMQHFHVRLGMSRLYANSKLGEMLDRVRELEQSDQELNEIDWNSLVEVQPGVPAVNPLFLVHGIGGGILWGYRNLAKQLPENLPVIAFASRATDGLPEFETLDEMVEKYLADLLCRQPVGPYKIGGYCLGGNIAHELACRLEALGEDVELLLFDAYPFLGKEDKLQLGSLGECLRFGGNLLRKISNLLNMPWDEKWRNLGRMSRWGRKWVCDRLFKKRGNSSDAAPIKNSTAATLTHINQYTPDQLALWEHHLRLFDGHLNGELNGSAHVIRTHSQPLYSVYADDLGWKKIVRGGVTVDFLSSHHESIFLEPHVVETAAAVVAALTLQPESSKS